jgi:hemerythrin-like metal-binding protein
MPTGWNDSDKTGNAPIDRQHQQWFSKVTFFVEATDDEGRLVAARKMRDFTRLHFEHEELLMDQIKYPEASEHKCHHEETTRQLDVLVRQVESGDVDPDHWKVILTDMFRRHILVDDLKLTAFITLQKRQARASPT